MRRPVSDKASHDAWLMLGCAVDWEEPTFKKNKTPGGGNKGNHIHRHSCGEGFIPDEIARVTALGNERFIHHSACIGASPYERRNFFYTHFKRNQ